ncbi:tRNA-splicing endonuclease subunit SEN15 [Nakaseomyces bracarensis]|uniref:tRNA-splicing endonuclease subunit SEN15 n=1 Tax=Nakaseomyces bracarensis TaxID=273131 RepID=A0ABR4NVX6_9SACH
MNSLTDRVRQNLVHFHQWTSVELVPRSLPWKNDRLIQVLTGRPPNKLSNDDQEEEINGQNRPLMEHILPVEMSQYKEGYLTLECMDKIFNELCPNDLNRILLAIVNDDGTVLYYFAHKGIYKPKRN